MGQISHHVRRLEASLLTFVRDGRSGPVLPPLNEEKSPSSSSSKPRLETQQTTALISAALSSASSASSAQVSPTESSALEVPKIEETPPTSKVNAPRRGGKVHWKGKRNGNNSNIAGNSNSGKNRGKNGSQNSSSATSTLSTHNSLNSTTIPGKGSSMNPSQGRLSGGKNTLNPNPCTKWSTPHTGPGFGTTGMFGFYANPGSVYGRGW